ncbi:4-hydroxythreonine-4-phosphate dehydrogenase PdxA [Chitinibacter sp. ZOR0017]|uniref:4-hydroxythreonine-4-phosphate dehydrogenase PdxA n=1 Tax=Chitinibacter sp. ZOR0017 TaxID=1339254 RepID=UPI000645615F|nr:4-hydroxythreonine-4-phosphate dehydrogenase PdxA [Chitinibacter sp. ZOR0017]
MQAAVVPLVITSGEPAGIGPEICVKVAAGALPQPCVILGSRQLLIERAACVGVDPALVASWPAYQANQLSAEHPPVAIADVPLAAPALAGSLNPANAHYVLSLLDQAIAGCQRGEFAGMVTAPIHKGVINEGTDGGYFSGHTEYLAEQTHTPQVVMMLAGEYGQQQMLRVALATTHLPLKAVSAALTPDSLRRTLQILHHDLQQHFGLAQPRILVAGLNPHAGESGHMGREEIDVIIPVLNELRAQGMQLIGPLPADTLFNPPILAQGDAVLAMYHDQGLPVLKFATFGAGINITLGLPLIRTSVDHGTALDLAGTGRAETGSLLAAYQLASQLAAARAV